VELYRLTRRPHADLTGAGGLHVTGRWHAHRAPIVYTSSSRALALLEALVHLSLAFEELPDDYVFQRIVADTDSLETIGIADIKAGGCAADSAAYGSAWLSSARTALLRVPSVVLPQESNILVNPIHADVATFSCEIESGVHWDRRLFG